MVTDDPMAELPNLKYMCPPKLLAKICSRAVAKAIWTFYAGIRHPADIFVGYHIFPSSVTALLCARFFGAKAIYQVTYGEAELSGGGWAAENALLQALGKPSDSVQKSAVRFANEFDLNIVRGTNAKSFLMQNGCNAPIEIVTGSVEAAKVKSPTRDIDIIFVARMAESKRPLFLLEVIAELVKSHPQLSAKMLGDGDQLEQAREKARSLGIESNVDFMGKRKDVMELLSRSKTFVLPSRWEGVSIALMEAMISGVVPLVSNVGDMADFVKHDETGYIFDMQEPPESYAEKLALLLSDHTELQRIRENALNFVTERSERKVLTARWHSLLTQLQSESMVK